MVPLTRTILILRSRGKRAATEAVFYHRLSMLNFQLSGVCPPPPGGEWTPHMKGVGMLVGNFELFLTPKRDHVKTQTNEKTWII